MFQWLSAFAWDSVPGAPGGFSRRKDPRIRKRMGKNRYYIEKCSMF